jgi:hypothetical protein
MPETIGQFLNEWLFRVTKRKYKGQSGVNNILKLTNFLFPLRAPGITKYLIIDCGNGWSAVIDNSIGGTDPIAAFSISKGLSVRTVYYIAIPQTLPSRPQKTDKGRWGGMILTVYDRGMVTRSVSSVNDGGRWAFDEAGEPFSFEDTTLYHRKSISSRLNKNVLDGYLHNLGIKNSFQMDNLQLDREFYLLERENNIDNVKIRYCDLSDFCL